jgi:hypothetical protein
VFVWDEMLSAVWAVNLIRKEVPEVELPQARCVDHVRAVGQAIETCARGIDREPGVLDAHPPDRETISMPTASRQSCSSCRTALEL